MGNAYTSTQAGNWSRTSDNADSPWYDAGTQTGWAACPGNGDTATVAHAVSVDANTIVGGSPNDTTTNAILINSAITLTVAGGISLTSRGRLYSNTGNFAMSAGSTLILDSHLSGGTPRYALSAPNYNAGSMTFNGTSGSRCTVRGYDATYRGEIKHYMGSTGVAHEATYTDFSYLGAESSLGYDVQGGGNNQTGYCTWTDCGRMFIYQTEAAGKINFHHCAVDAATSRLYIETGAFTSGSATCTDNVILCLAFNWLLAGCEVTRCYFGAQANFVGNWGTAGKAVDCVFTGAVNGLVNSYIPLQNCYLYHPYTGNPHYSYIYADYRNTTIEGCIFETVADSDDGDGFQTGTWTAPYELILKNNIGLPSPAGHSPGDLLNMASDVDTLCKLTHNTWLCGGISAAMIVYGELGTPAYADQIQVQSNIVWANAGHTGYVANRFDQTPNIASDVIDPDNCSHNWRWGLANGTEGNGFNDAETGNDMFSVGTGTFDQECSPGGDPQFADSTRNLAKWSAYKEEAETVAAGLTLLRGDTSLIADLVTWVKAGFVVENPDLYEAGHDNETIGACAYGGPAIYRLTCATGDYRITPTAASLVVSRKLSAATGDYRITPTAASLLLSRMVKAATGDYRITPTAASLLAARKLAAATGDYRITPTNATLTYTPVAGGGAYGAIAYVHRRRRR